ncbi:hypothetical protein Xkoz_03817 [Xenorhabdus kozodoii]|uniref:Uncharacterized protein n=1 Tax=Xenorhabdus kozodoii TaxID=351676 RepID=A0A2D0KUL8_9GAMM|nr:hypothetical protein Xkoz_03817 [Xenorhabdus kozodoii]
MLAKLLAQCRRHQFRPVLWPQVGDQSFLVGFIFAGDHHRFAYPVTLGQSGLDFPQFDAEAAQFDLKIIAAKVVDIAVGQPAAKVTGFVHPGIGFRSKGIDKETLGGQFGAVEGTAGDTGTANIHFPGHPDGNRLFMRIQNVNPGIGNRAADRNGARHLNGRRDPIGGGKCGGFRWAIAIDQVGRLGHCPLHLLDFPWIKHIPADKQVTQLTKQGRQIIQVLVK